MKEKYCVINYNKLTRKWNLFLKSPLLNAFLENKSKNKMIYEGKRLASNHNLKLYIYDKENKLIEKRDYVPKNL